MWVGRRQLRVFRAQRVEITLPIADGPRLASHHCLLKVLMWRRMGKIGELLPVWEADTSLPGPMMV